MKVIAVSPHVDKRRRTGGDRCREDKRINEVRHGIRFTLYAGPLRGPSGSDWGSCSRTLGQENDDPILGSIVSGSGLPSGDGIAMIAFDRAR